MRQKRVTKSDFGRDSWGQKRVTRGALEQPGKKTGNEGGSKVGFELKTTMSQPARRALVTTHPTELHNFDMPWSQKRVTKAPLAEPGAKAGNERGSEGNFLAGNEGGFRDQAFWWIVGGPPKADRAKLRWRQRSCRSSHGNHGTHGGTGVVTV
ncbi:hypothetical protein K438DRAFT_1747868 [Mycena galopus ATCC 62051]|nr:hypothetical protein K438DRAFT_1747868 [Mycena galopus ATCC 62051]